MGAGVLVLAGQLVRRLVGIEIQGGAEASIGPLVAIGVGAALWFLPWEDISVGATLLVPLALLSVIPLLDYLSSYRFNTDPEYLYPAVAVLTLAWVGLVQPPLTVVKFGPFVAVFLYVALVNSPPRLVSVDDLGACAPPSGSEGRINDFGTLYPPDATIVERDRLADDELARRASVGVAVPASCPQQLPLTRSEIAACADGEGEREMLHVLEHCPQSTAPEPWAAIFVVIPIAVFVGEVVAWAAEGQRVALAADRRRADDLETLSMAVAQLKAKSSTEQAANIIADVACHSFHSDDVLVVVRRRDGRLAVAKRGNPARLPVEDVETLLGQAALDSGVRESSRSNGDGVVPMLTIPLVGANGLSGVVVARQDDHPDLFTLHAAQMFATQAGAALAQRETVEASAEDARRDALTGLGNRRHAQELISSVLPGDAISIIDLDHFKSINDTDGHSAGDDVLRNLGGFLRAAVRDSDSVARYGGEEFVVVQKGVSENAFATAKRLVEGWRNTSPRTTFSVGVAVCREGESPQETLERADQALYRAKEQGRDRAIEAT